MLIHKFINSISRSDLSNFKTLKQLHRLLNNIHYSPELHKKLLLHDFFAYPEIDGGKLYSREWLKVDKFTLDILIKLFVPYAIEKFICFSNCKTKKQININIKDIELFNILYNSFNNAGNIDHNIEDTTFYVKKLLFLTFYEQYQFQKREYFYVELFRLFNLYKTYSEVEDFLILKIGINLKEFSILSLILFKYINQNGKIKIKFSIDEFIKYANYDTIISKDMILKYINYISINEEEFKKKYFVIREDSNKKDLMPYNELQKIDKYLPKVSYLYPLLLDEEQDKLLLLSYTSLKIFFKFERIYLDIYHNDNIKDFKSKIHGHAINDYIKTFIQTNIYDKKVKIYGDEKYYPIQNNGKKSKNKCDAPDVIVEFDNFVIIIECKSKPFDLLNSLKNFGETEFKRIREDKIKSELNIKRYFENVNSFSNKKVYKFVSYFFDNPFMLNIAEFNLDKKLDSQRIIITDIKSIELLFMIKGISLDDILDNFIKLAPSEITNENSFGMYIIDNYSKYIDTSIIDEHIKQTFKDMFNSK